MTWYHNLPTTPTENCTWEEVKAKFQNRYINIDFSQNPALLAETAETELFNVIKLAPQQSIDEFHALLVNKGRRLMKHDTDIMIRFIDAWFTSTPCIFCACRTTYM